MPNGPTVNVVGNQVAVVCDEATRERLIALREKITLADRRSKTQPEPVEKLQANLGAPIGNLAGNDAAAPDGPCSIWSAPAGTTPPGDASPVLRA